MKRINFSVWVAVIGCLVAPNSWAAPAINSVNGVIAHMQSITISGSGFGEKSPAKPYLWAPFDNGSINPSNLGMVTSWNVNENMSFNPNEGVGGTGCAKASDNSGTWTLAVNANGFAWNDYSQKMYLFRKTKRNFDVGSTNWKVWRVWSDNYSYPNVYINTGTCCGNVGVEGLEESGGWIDVSKTVGPTGSYFTEEIMMKSNSNASSADGSFAMYTNGVCGIELPYTDYSTKVWKMKDNSATGSSSMIMNFVVHGVKANTSFPSTYRYWADDVYLDKTWARVMLGDKSSWTACTKKEPQIPSAWSNTSITVTVNTGAFPANQLAYLYVVDSTGAVNASGYPMTIGGGGGTVDPPASVQITSPTSGSSTTTTVNTVNIGGSASDDKGIATIRWTNDQGGSGTAINNSGNWTSWSVNDISLIEGQNAITVTATDSAGQTSSAQLIVTYSKTDGSGEAWSAINQTLDTSWKDSGVTYCVRLLVQGANVTKAGNTIQLAFKGRNNGSYTLRKVSIAQRDISSAEGNVVDSTWTKVTFDGRSSSTWDADTVTVNAGTEKLSNQIPFTLKPNVDYYITFKIDTPSVYLDPPSGYRELYFYSDDHTGDVDWSGNGFDATQDFHAAAKIYVVASGDSLQPPAGLRVQ